MSEMDDVLGAFSRVRAAPGERLDRLALVRSGLDARSVASGLSACASRGYVIDHGFTAELTDAGYRAILGGRLRA